MNKPKKESKTDNNVDQIARVSIKLQWAAIGFIILLLTNWISALSDVKASSGYTEKTVGQIAISQKSLIKSHGELSTTVVRMSSSVSSVEKILNSMMFATVHDSKKTVPNPFPNDKGIKKSKTKMAKSPMNRADKVYPVLVEIEDEEDD